MTLSGHLNHGFEHHLVCWCLIMLPVSLRLLHIWYRVDLLANCIRESFIS